GESPPPPYSRYPMD
nr:Chain B, Smad7 derived peptide [Homo sapiens]